ncbi:MAG: hypothetical protein AABW64_02985 [Nanoarchaeota archaeon]
MKKSLYGIITVFLLSVLLLSPISISAQQSPEKIAKMLTAFDDPALLQGFVSATFVDTVTKDDAEAVLKSYKLRFYPKRNCTTATDPATGKEKKTCTAEDAWDDKTKTALIIVKDGREKSTAQLLLEKSALVVRVDPAFEGKNGPAPPTKKTDDDEAKTGETSDKSGADGNKNIGSEVSGFFSKIISWFKGLFTG